MKTLVCWGMAAVFAIGFCCNTAEAMEIEYDKWVDGTLKPWLKDHPRWKWAYYPSLESPNHHCLMGGDEVTDKDLADLSTLPGLRDVALLQATRVTEEGLANLASHKELLGLALAQMTVTDSGAALISSLPLRRMDLSGVQGLTAEGWGHIGKIQTLEHLFLNGSVIDDEGFLRLNSLTALQTLAMMNLFDITDAGCGIIAGKQQLSHLAFNRCPSVTDKTMPSVKSLPRLVRFHVQGCNGVTAVGLRDIAQNPAIHHVILGGDAVDDGQMVPIAAMPNLTELWLLFTVKVTDAEGMKTLEKGCPSLKRLQLSGIRGGITRAGVDSFKDKRPEIAVIADFMP